MLDYRRFKEINDLFAAGQAEQARRLLMELQSRCIALRDEMHALEEILYLSKHLRQENGVYWLTTAGVRQGPFCPYCYDTLGTLIRLEAREFSLSCPACGQGHPLPPPAAAPRMARIIPFAR